MRDERVRIAVKEQPSRQHAVHGGHEQPAPLRMECVDDLVERTPDALRIHRRQRDPVRGDRPSARLIVTQQSTTSCLRPQAAGQLVGPGVLCELG
ncbi:hypothetical protein [Streptomyces phaeofaciens]|uniref:hypothetical protein n=1 Tax=Streptomyces phaeofaciens TaxID=68254 RepID=UPI001674C037|nr:hypothetical protein [Streptomyces phaeofaciens]